MNAATYDPRMHVTARELRAAGYHFDTSVPDHHWVPRGSIALQPGDGPGVPLKIVFTVPFAGDAVTAE